MGSKKNFAKLMKSSLSSSKKRKLDEAEMESADEPEYAAKDKELKALRDLLTEKDAKIAEQQDKIADLQKQLDWAMNTAALHEKMAKMSDEIAEIKNAQAQAASTVIAGAPHTGQFLLLEDRVVVLEADSYNQGETAIDLKQRAMDCERTLEDHTEEIKALAEKVEKLETGQLDKLLGKTIKDFLEGESK